MFGFRVLREDEYERLCSEVDTLREEVNAERARADRAVDELLGLVGQTPISGPAVERKREVDKEAKAMQEALKELYLDETEVSDTEEVIAPLAVATVPQE